MIRKPSIIAMVLVVYCLSLSVHAQSIHEAVKTNNIEQIKRLLEKDSKLVNSLDGEHNTPLILACQNLNVNSEILAVLIQFGADLQLGDPDNDTPLHYAAYSGNSKAAKILIQHNAEIDSKDVRDQTPLHFAVVKGNIEIVRLLIDNNANIDAVRYYKGSTSLHMALDKKNEELAEFLITKGAKLVVRDKEGKLPIHVALEICSNKIIDLILDKKANINMELDGANLIEAAIKCRHSRLISLLIEGGVNIIEVNPIGQTLMHRAAANGLIDLMKTLQEKGVSTNKKDVYGKRPIHMATKQGHLNAVEFLIKNGADLDSKTPMGKTALNMAQEMKQTAIVNLLIKNNAKQEDWKLPKMKSDYIDKNVPKNIPQLFAPGIISTEENHDYAISFHPNGKELLLSTRVYGGSNYLSSMKYVNNQWSALNRPYFASDYPEGEPIFSPDGKQIIFQSTRPKPGSNKNDFDAWIVNNTDNPSEPQLLPEPFKEPQFLMYISSTSNNKIYFTSNGGSYSAVKTDAGYEEAVFLGGNINSPNEGKHPFIAPDESYLIFDANNRLDGQGESDLYISFRKEDGTWTKGQNLGDKINSSANEICASVSGDGKFLFYNSGRNGNGDIYWVDTSFIDELKAKATTKNKEIFDLQYQTLGKSRSFSIVNGDLNNDGYQDILMVNYFSPSRLWFNKGDNTFEMMPDNINANFLEEHGGAIADIDNDGDLDIAIVTTEQGENKIHLNDGTGKFVASQSDFLTKGVGYGHVYLEDADGDQDLDAFLLVYRQSNELWLNDGKGNFSKSEQIIGNEKSGDMGVADFDGDNDIDVFLTVEDGPNEIWLNDGKGNFEKSEEPLGDLDGIESVTLADFDKDGDMDAAVTNFSHGITIWLNDGKAKFRSNSEVFSHGRSIQHADIDNDGDVDLYCSDRLHGDVVLLNDGKANFTEEELINEISIRSGFVDIDNDGDLDLILSKGLNVRGNGVYINQTQNKQIKK